MLWNYLLDDKIDMVVSDHSPCTPDLKCSNNLEAWGGISSVQFGTLYLLFVIYIGTVEQVRAHSVLSQILLNECGF